MGFPLTVQLLLPPVQLLLAPQGPLHTLLHAAAAHPFHRRPANLEGPGDIPVLHHPVPLPLIAQQQDAGVGLPVGRRPPLVTIAFNSCRSSTLSLTLYFFSITHSPHLIL